MRIDVHLFSQFTIIPFYFKCCLSIQASVVLQNFIKTLYKLHDLKAVLEVRFWKFMIEFSLYLSDALEGMSFE